MHAIIGVKNWTFEVISNSLHMHHLGNISIPKCTPLLESGAQLLALNIDFIQQSSLTKEHYKHMAHGAKQDRHGRANKTHQEQPRERMAGTKTGELHHMHRTYPSSWLARPHLGPPYISLRPIPSPHLYLWIRSGPSNADRWENLALEQAWPYAGSNIPKPLLEST